MPAPFACWVLYWRSMASRRKTLLVVDADEASRERLAHILKRDDRVLRASSAEAALGMLGRDGVDLVLADRALARGERLRLPAHRPRELPAGRVRDARRQRPTSTRAVQAMKLGAYHLLVKDADPEAVLSIVAHAAERQDLNRQVLALADQVRDQSGDREFVSGPSPATREVLERVHKVAGLPATVLILGESGTGKELVARMIHRHSELPDGPFIPVNLAAIPRELVESTLFGHEKGSFTGALRQQIGKFELAHGGTLFLDEIGDLKLDLQAKLLRAIQEGEIERVGGGKPIKVQFRLIAATNVDLERGVREGHLPRGPLLPHQRHPDPHSAAARADRGPARAGAVLPHPLQHAVPQERAGLRHVDAGDAAELLVAGQHPRAREPGRAAGRHLRPRLDHRRRPAVRAAGGRDGSQRRRRPICSTGR